MGKHFGPLQFLVPAVLAIVFLAFASAASGAQNPCSTGVCVSSETIYVLDTDNHRVQTLTAKASTGAISATLLICQSASRWIVSATCM